MRTKVAKWGNSLALRLPKQVTQSQNLTEGVDLEITEESNGFFIRPITKDYKLEDLLGQITKENIHAESLITDPIGKEIW